MVTKDEFLDFAARVFGVPASGLTLETSYGTIPEWDSMAQLHLVMEVAAKYGVEIPFADVVKVVSLWEFWRRINGLPVKKVIAVDLDNTLWDGVVGEDGLDGIRPRTAFQQQLKALKERGVLLVALSKNNPEDLDWLFYPKAPWEMLAEKKNFYAWFFDPLRQRILPTGMVLDEANFVTWRINWDSKPGNLLSVARELNLGLDAFVFVDDNPAERLEMRMKLPEVTVAEFPPNVEAYFPPHVLTDEDRDKTEEYIAEAERLHLMAKADDRLPLTDLLGVWVDAHELRGEEVPRVAQLSQKANQFNVLTNRYNEDEVRRLAAEGLVLTVHTGDKFGDQGLVAYVVVKDAEIVDWVMSCRVMGRGVENQVERTVEELLAARGVGELRAAWRDSGRNAPVRDLFDRLGFDLVSADESERRYRRAIPAPSAS